MALKEYQQAVKDENKKAAEGGKKKGVAVESEATYPVQFFDEKGGFGQERVAIKSSDFTLEKKTVTNPGLQVTYKCMARFEKAPEADGSSIISDEHIVSELKVRKKQL
jgi:hypothetical protein